MRRRLKLPSNANYGNPRAVTLFKVQRSKIRQNTERLLKLDVRTSEYVAVRIHEAVRMQQLMAATKKSGEDTTKTLREVRQKNIRLDRLNPVKDELMPVYWGLKRIPTT